MKKWILSLSLFSFGCATTHPGTFAQSLSPGSEILKVSADPVSQYSDETNIYLDFTLENKGSRWLKIDQVSIDFPNSEGAIHNIIVGDDLKAWAESYANKKRMQDYNADIGAAALILSGVTVALVSGGRNTSLLGATAAAGGSTWMAARGVNQDREKAIRAVSVPETYLIAPMTIPSGGFVRRWVLVNVPSRTIAKNAILTLKTLEGETLKYQVPIVF